MNPEKRQMLDLWADSIGGVKPPQCSVCNKICDSLSMDFDLTRNEFLFETKCHGDTQVFHLSTMYADMISRRLAAKKLEAGTDALQWSLPEAFDTVIAARFDGKLHYDFDKVLDAKVKVKQAEDTTPKAELEAKAMFEEEWDHAKAKGQVRTVTVSDKDAE